MLRRLKIVLQDVVGSDGKSKIFDADTGEELTNVRSIKIEAGVDKVTTVRLELVGVEIEGEVTAQIVAETTAIGQHDGYKHFSAV